MKKQVLGSGLVLMLMATPVVAEIVLADATPPMTPVAYAAEPVPTLTSYNAYAQPTVALISANRDDVLQVISDMRAKLDDFGSLALDNGISQTADAFVEHWNLAVDYNVAAQHEAVQTMIGDMVHQSSYLIQDFLLTPTIPAGDSLFSQTPVTDSVASAPSGGFFAQ